MDKVQSVLAEIVEAITNDSVIFFLVTLGDIEDEEKEKEVEEKDFFQN